MHPLVYIYTYKGIGNAKPKPCLYDILSSLEPHLLFSKTTFLSFASFRLQDSCKFYCSRFRGEGVTLKFLSCLNRLSSIWEQLSCLESVFRLLGKRTGRCQEESAVCIVRHTRNILSSVVAVLSLP